MKKIIVVGSLNMDLVINAPYAPRGGETIMGSGFMVNSGGKGANQACATAKLGGNAYMCGCVGDDSFGSDLINNLKNVASGDMSAAFGNRTKATGTTSFVSGVDS